MGVVHEQSRMPSASVRFSRWRLRALDPHLMRVTIGLGTEMGRPVAIVLYVMAMVAVIVGVDFGFFKNRFWPRLIANIGIVLVFVAFYLRFLSRPVNSTHLR